MTGQPTQGKSTLKNERRSKWRLRRNNASIFCIACGDPFATIEDLQIHVGECKRILARQQRSESADRLATAPAGVPAVSLAKGEKLEQEQRRLTAADIKELLANVGRNDAKMSSTANAVPLHSYSFEILPSGASSLDYVDAYCDRLEGKHGREWVEAHTDRLRFEF